MSFPQEFYAIKEETCDCLKKLPSGQWSIRLYTAAPWLLRLVLVDSIQRKKSAFVKTSICSTAKAMAEPCSRKKAPKNVWC